MKKGPRNIPDFSSKKKSAPLVKGQDKLAPPPHTPSTIAKPKATSSKSGRRGS